MFLAKAKTVSQTPPTTSATGKMKTIETSPAEPQGRRESPQGAWASRPLSTHGRDGSPQPSLDSGTNCRHEGRLHLKNGASRRSAPTMADQKIRPTPCVSPSVFFESLAPARLALRANPRLLHLAFPKRSIVVKSSAFSLVELLVVMAIIGMMVGLSAMAVQGMRAPAVQHAADQVMSGLSLARQIAITKNTHAALLIADKTSAGFPTNGPYRHWSVVYSNRGTSGNWTIAKDWEELPNGAVFSELLTSSGSTMYNPITKNPFNISAGQNLPSSYLTPGNGTTNFTILANGNSTTITTVPCIRFSSSGEATNAAIAIRISPGSVLGGNATITGTNQYYFVETDTRTGRIRMRSPESYR